MDKVQNLSLELLLAAAELVKATKNNEVMVCINLSERINMINTEIQRVIDTYKKSC